LRHQDKRATCVAIRLRYADFETIIHQITLRQASNANQVIYTAALQLLNETLAEKRKPIRLIGVKVSNLAGKEKQLRLFDLEREKTERLDKAIDQIRRKYGPTVIKAGEI
jgi:DNA polymerase-4